MTPQPCRNGGCGAQTTQSYVIPGVREPKPICPDCLPRITALYGEVTPDRRVATADRRRRAAWLGVPRIRRAG